MNPAPLPASIPLFGTLLPWAQSTFYYKDLRVTANGNIYKCTTQGTSSNAGTGPSGGGGAISDGTVVWAFQSAISTAWVQLTPYTAGDVVTNDGGKLYEAQNTGTSGNNPGPTGTGTAITDGSIVWSYVSVATAQQTQPTSRVGDIGAVPGGLAFAQYENWWKANVDAWIAYTRDRAVNGAWQSPFAFNCIQGTAALNVAAVPAVKITGLAITAVVYIPLDVKRGQIITNVDVRVSQGAATSITLFKTSGLSTTGAPPSAGAVAGAVQTPGGTGEKMVTLTPTTPVLVGEDDSYMIEFGSGSVNDLYYGARPY